MIRVIWSAAAEEDRDAHIEYVAAFSPRAAASLGDSVWKAIDQLRSFPESGRRGRLAGTREYVIVGTPYLVIYSFAG